MTHRWWLAGYLAASKQSVKKLNVILNETIYFLVILAKARK
jgi:hypothetical protein